MCYNQTGDISTLEGTPLKLVDKFTYLGSSVESTEKDIETRLTKAWTAIDRLSIIWKSDLADKMKHSFFQAAVTSIGSIKVFHRYKPKSWQVYQRAINAFSPEVPRSDTVQHDLYPYWCHTKKSHWCHTKKSHYSSGITITNKDWHAIKQRNQTKPKGSKCCWCVRETETKDLKCNIEAIPSHVVILYSKLHLLLHWWSSSEPFLNARLLASPPLRPFPKWLLSNWPPALRRLKLWGYIIFIMHIFLPVCDLFPLSHLFTQVHILFRKSVTDRSVKDQCITVEEQ